jgi:hypothetical protein
MLKKLSLITLLTAFLLTYYFFKFPSHYGFGWSFDFSYLFVIFLLLAGSLYGPKISKIYFNFALFYGFLSAYMLIYSSQVAGANYPGFADFIEGDAYFSKPSGAWVTSILSQYIFLCLIPPFLASLPKDVLIISLRVFLSVNVYFALWQVLSVLNIGLLDLLPIKIGVVTVDGFNLSFGRAVGFTAAHGAFYYSYGVLIAVMLLSTIAKIRWFDICFVFLSLLSLSRTVFLVVFLYFIFYLINRRVRLFWWIILFIKISIISILFFNSSIWELRMLGDRSADVRGGQLDAALANIFEFPLGIGSNNFYFFDSSFVALIVEFGFIGILGFVCILIYSLFILLKKYSSIESLILLSMLIFSIALIGSPFAYLPTLMLGMFIYNVSKPRYSFPN